MANSPIANVVQVSPERLADLYISVSKTLGAVGLDEKGLEDVFVGNVGAECVLCGLKLTVAELALLAATDPKNPPPEGKFARLRMGYCGRTGCESRYYTVRLTEHPMVDWTTVLAQTRLGPPVPAEVPPIPALRPWFRRVNRKTLVRLAAGLAIVLAWMLTQHIMNGGRIPLVQPKHNYSLHPASIEVPGGSDH